jgi:large subunit ribosomal protein L3
MVKGAVPGSKGGWVTIKDSVKKKKIDGLPFPAALRSTQKTGIPDSNQEQPDEQAGVTE